MLHCKRDALGSVTNMLYYETKLHCKRNMLHYKTDALGSVTNMLYYETP